ncbi:MAG TPA: TRAM domain-containing protein, partial [Microlunatus sp.]|nr:TRAM domain-containing protein [Microlunatus sp.]
VEVGPIAHGGHCVARLDGRVVFVRHALPGERVRIAVTDTTHDSFWRADAVEVLEASPDRVERRCPVSGPGRCGGCDFQHVSLPGQRRLKADVLAEQLRRLADLDWDGEVEAVTTTGTEDGLHWRTRMRYHVDADGRPGLRRHRSHEIEPLPTGGCPIAHVDAPAVTGQRWTPDTELLAVAADPATLLVDGRAERGTVEVTEHAVGRDWQLAADGFWQGHPGAAATLVEVVMDGLRPRAGERALDLYCGVGLFAGALVDLGVRTWGIEWSRAAVEHARRNVPGARFTAGKVERAVRTLPKRTDLVVLDPPRTGAGKDVIDAIVARRPRAIAYVACDPAALARDLRRARSGGYQVRSIRAFDLFPMTHHLEAVALLEQS